MDETRAWSDPPIGPYQRVPVQVYQADPDAPEVGVDPAWWTPKMRALPSRWESDATPPTVLPAGVQG